MAAWAEDDGVAVVGTTYLLPEADEFDGSQYRDALAEAMERRTDVAARWTSLQPVLAFCDSKKDSGDRVWVSVSTQTERDELTASRPDADLAFVDIACPRAYTMGAYFAADEGDADKAIAWLDRARQLAPFSAAPVAERAFLYNAAGNRKQALATYRQALDLAERYPSSAGEKPLVLRGIGWTLVELGDFAGARRAYEQSLVVDPGNKTAKAELDYLRRLEDQGHPAPDTPPFATKATKGSALAPDLPDDQAKVIELTRVLESQPFHPEARQMRSALINWLSKSPDITVTACNTLKLLGEDSIPYSEELFVQSLFGAATHLIQHRDDPLLAEQLAGVESALLAYAAVLREHPDAHVALLDELLRHQAEGDLEATVERMIAEDCSADETGAAPAE